MMKKFTFNSPYLSGVRTGVQSVHASDEMWVKYLDDTAMLSIISDHARNHKTVVILESPQPLVRLTQLFGGQPQYPWAFFAEPDLSNAFTSVSIIVPERLYDPASIEYAWRLNEVSRYVGLAAPNVAGLANVEEYLKSDYTEWEKEFIIAKASCRLAS